MNRLLRLIIALHLLISGFTGESVAASNRRQKTDLFISQALALGAGSVAPSPAAERLDIAAASILRDNDRFIESHEIRRLHDWAQAGIPVRVTLQGEPAAGGFVGWISRSISDEASRQDFTFRLKSLMSQHIVYLDFIFNMIGAIAPLHSGERQALDHEVSAIGVQTQDYAISGGSAAGWTRNDLIQLEQWRKSKTWLRIQSMPGWKHPAPAEPLVVVHLRQDPDEPAESSLVLMNARRQKFYFSLFALAGLSIVPDNEIPPPPDLRTYPWLLPPQGTSPKDAVYTLAAQQPAEMAPFRSILRSLLEEFGSVAAMAGKNGIEYGAAGQIGLFNFLRDNGIDVVGVDRYPTGGSPYSDYLHGMTFGEYAQGLPAESVDFMYSKISFYPQYAVYSDELAQLLRILKKGAIFVFAIFGGEKDMLRLPFPLETLGIDLVDPGTPIEEGMIRYVWRKQLKAVSTTEQLTQTGTDEMLRQWADSKSRFKNFAARHRWLGVFLIEDVGLKTPTRSRWQAFIQSAFPVSLSVTSILVMYLLNVTYLSMGTVSLLAWALIEYGTHQFVYGHDNTLDPTLQIEKRKRGTRMMNLLNAMAALLSSTMILSAFTTPGLPPLSGNYFVVMCGVMLFTGVAAGILARGLVHGTWNTYFQINGHPEFMLEQSSPRHHVVDQTSELTIVQRPDLRLLWDLFVEEHLSWVLFAKDLNSVTAEHQLLWNWPSDEVYKLLHAVNFSKPPDQLAYRTSVITLNLHDEPGQAGQTLLNLALLMAMQRAKIELTAVAYRSLGLTLGSISQEWHKFFRTADLGGDPRQHWFWFELQDSFRRSMFSRVGKEKIPKELGYILFDLFGQPKRSFQDFAARREYSQHPPYVAVRSDFEKLLPPEFSEHPSDFLESRPDYPTPGPHFGQGERVGTPGSARDATHLLPLESIGKIKRLVLTDGSVLFAKRVNLLRVRTPTEEIEIAERLEPILQNVDARFHAQRFIGLAFEKGSFYLLSESAPADHTGREEESSPEIQRLLEALAGNEEPPAFASRRREDILVGQDRSGAQTYTVIDFETLPYSRSVRGGV